MGKFKYSATSRECEVVVEYLKKRSEEVQLKDMITATRMNIDWPDANPSEKMNAIMKMESRISRVKKGFYGYVEIDPKVQKQVAKAIARVSAPMAEKPKLPPAAVVTPPKGFPITNVKSIGDVRVGQQVQGSVTGIFDYGVFVDIPELEMSGLLHRTKIKFGKTFFNREDLDRHFRFGDWINCKIDSFRSNGRLALTTIGFELPDYSSETPIAQQLEKLNVFEKEKTIAVAEKPAYVEQKPKYVEPKPTPMPAPAPAPIQRAAPVNTITSTRDELDELFEMIRKKVGVISLSAKDVLRDIVRQNGIVKVTMALMTSGDFEADVSLAYVRHIEKKASGGL